MAAKTDAPSSKGYVSDRGNADELEQRVSTRGSHDSEGI
jgi:hypothetical protein